MKDLREFGFNTDNKAYVIAEIGINHGGSLSKAIELVESAAKTGADAVKFQTYITEKRAPKGNKEVFNIFKKHELPFEDFKEIKSCSENLGLDFFSTAFDKESLDYLESIDCPIYKIASFDVVNNNLLREVSKTQKPVIMSVGMANLDEVTAAYKILNQNTDKIALLHCISAYPTQEKDANLSAMVTLRNKFNCVIGQSDHTSDIKVPLYAVAAGAQIIEKHYKISADMECIDAPVSITETQLTDMVTEIRRIENIFGSGNVDTREVEKAILPFRRPTE